MHKFHRQAIGRLRAAVLPDAADSSIVKWIPKHTKIKGKPFSYVGHEYQAEIIACKARDIFVKKCSQIGLSELVLRKVLAFSQVNPGTTTIYSMPVAGLANKVSKTRFAPMMRESYPDGLPTIAGNDSAELKEFKNGSFIYFVGGVAIASQISVPSDQLVYDELNFFEDLSIPSKLESRLTHSEHKLKFSLSTPTLPDYGISAGFNSSRQNIELQKCRKCNHWFEPSYFSDIVIPGFDDDIKQFHYQNRRIMELYDVNSAYLRCPKCGAMIDQDVKYREWVVKNSDSRAESIGFQVTPFSAPAFISIPNLIRTACTYKSYTDFYNFSLGMDHTDSEVSLVRSDFDELFPAAERFIPPYACIGLDMGGMSACLIGYPSDESLNIVHAEMIPVAILSKRVQELKLKYKCINLVVDSLPYTETVSQFQQRDSNCWAALYGSSKNLYVKQEKEDTVGTALSGMRVVNISRDRMFDYVAGELKSKNIKFLGIDPETKDRIISHCLDMKKVKKFDKDGELVYTWVKSDKGEDHYFHSLAYMVTAALMKGFDSFTGPPALSALPMVRTIKCENF